MAKKKKKIEEAKPKAGSAPDEGELDDDDLAKVSGGTTAIAGGALDLRARAVLVRAAIDPTQRAISPITIARTSSS